MARIRRPRHPSATPEWVSSVVTVPRVKRWLVGLLIAGAAACVVATSVAVGPAVMGPVECCAAAERITPPSTLPPSNSVVVIGDSMIYGITSPRVLGSSNTIQAHLSATGRTVFAVGEIGKSTPWGVGVVRSNPAVIRGADVVLLGFGTNEVLDTPGLSVATSRSAIDKMIAALRLENADVRIVWVDVSVERLAQRTASWNRALDEAEQQVDDFHVCRWRSIALASPTSFDRDGVHLTTSGYRERRDVLINCVIGD